MNLQVAICFSFYASPGAESIERSRYDVARALKDTQSEQLKHLNNTVADRVAR